MIIAISFALALFLCTVLVPITMKYAAPLGLLDTPDGERKVHVDPIPRCGGVAIAIAVFVPALFWLRDVIELSGFFIGALVIVIFGLLDDRHNLNYKWKFFGQFIAVAIFLLGDVDITKTPFSGMGDVIPWFTYALMGLFILGVTNAVNLSDGLDGLAAGSSLLSLGFLAYLSYLAGEISLVLIAVATMGSLLGFLRYNTHPASVFMGDTGSQFLGYVAACLTLMLTQSESSAVSPVIAVMIVGLPILDTFSVMLLRLRDGASPFTPDRRHLHHQFLAIGMRHYQAVAALYILNFVLLGLAFLVMYQSDTIVLLTYLLFCSSTLGMIAFLKNSAFSRRRREVRAENNERRNLFFRKLGWLHLYGATTTQIILGFIWITCVCAVSDLPESTPWWSFLGGIAVLAVWRFSDRRYPVLTRIPLYAASAGSLFVATYYGNLYETPWGDFHLLIDGLFLLLVLVLALSIRLTRKEHFRLDTQDVLVLLVLLASPLVTLTNGDQSVLIGAIIRLAIMLYAVEYIFGRAEKFKIINTFSLLMFAILLARSIYF